VKGAANKVKGALNMGESEIEEMYANFIAEYEAVLEENGVTEYDEEEAMEFFVEQFGELFVEAKDEDEKEDLEESTKSDRKSKAREEAESRGVDPSSRDNLAGREGLKGNALKSSIRKNRSDIAVNAPYREKLPENVQESFQFQLSDQLGGLLESEGLTDEFKTQATTIFEAAVNAAAKGHIESIQEQLQEQYESDVAAYKEKLDEQVEKYLDYVVEEWVKEIALPLNLLLVTTSQNLSWQN